MEPLPSARQELRLRPSDVLPALAALTVVVVGVFGPWGTLSVGEFELSLSGFEGDNKGTFVIFGAGVSAAMIARRGRANDGTNVRRGALIAALVAAGALLYSWHKLHSGVFAIIGPQMGWGFWTAAAGTGVLLTLSLLGVRREESPASLARTTPSPQPTPESEPNDRSAGLAYTTYTPPWSEKK